MPSLNTALYSSLANDASRQAYSAQLRAQQELVAAQLRDTVRLTPGSTISALYEYKVGADGSLLPLQTRITTEPARNASLRPAGNEPARQEEALGDALRRQTRNRTPRFADFAPVRAELSPSDELALFAAADEQPAPTPAEAAAGPAANLPTQSLSVAAAQEADGTPIDVELLPPDSASGRAANDNAAPVTSLAARNQTRVANLYARNNDIVFNVTPLSQFAA